LLRLFELALVAAAVLIVLRACHARSGPPLNSWHSLAAEEASAKDILQADWQDYVAMEHALFARVRSGLDAALTPRDDHPLNRYTNGSLSSPSRFARNWNRSYRLQKAGTPRGVVVLVHGLTDSPYSMLEIARFYQAAGWVALVPRMPGHGTVPGALARVDRSQWQAAVAMAMTEARERAQGRLPVHLVGYSNGAALALLHEVERVRDGEPADAEHLVLLSPMVRVSAGARYAGLAGLPAVLPGFARAAWVDVLPEYNPFKYNSFPVHAARESYLVTAALHEGLDALAQARRLHGLPPILAFQSVVDDTVDAPAVDRLLLDRLSSPGNQLVVFDVNRVRLLESLQHPGTTAWADTLLAGPPHRHAVTVVGANAQDDAAVVARTRAAGARAIATQPLGVDYPVDVYSLSHIALPFDVDDPLYGRIPHADHPLQLGAIALRGERNALVVPQASLDRLSYNPFHAYMLARIGALLQAPRTEPVPWDAGP
jgi:alpha-beta hydrolase superfamily lysophospholipase